MRVYTYVFYLFVYVLIIFIYICCISIFPNNFFLFLLFLKTFASYLHYPEATSYFRDTFLISVQKGKQRKTSNITNLIIQILFPNKYCEHGKCITNRSTFLRFVLQSSSIFTCSNLINCRIQPESGRIEF